MGSGKIIRRRLWFNVVTLVLWAAATGLLVAGLALQRSGSQAEARLRGAGQDANAIVPSILSEVAKLKGGNHGASATRLREWVEECDEELTHISRRLSRLASDSQAYREMLDEWDEVVAGSEAVLVAAAQPEDPEKQDQAGKALDKMQVDLPTFARDFDKALSAAREGAQRRAYSGVMCAKGALASMVLAGLWSAMILFLSAAEALSASEDSVDLAAELGQALGNPRVTARLDALRGPEAATLAEDTRWEVGSVRQVGERRTHIVFEAELRRGGGSLMLWGRRYRLPGRIKRFQRVFFPAFESAYWRGLCQMRCHGLPGPMPVAHVKRRRGLFNSGGLVLCEHMGELENVKTFMRGEFCLMQPEDRREFVWKTVDFLAHCHAAGIYRISMRYLHGRDIEHPRGEMQFFLMDLDKVLLWEGCPRLFKGFLRRADERRLRRLLRECLDREEYAEAGQHLRA